MQSSAVTGTESGCKRTSLQGSQYQGKPHYCLSLCLYVAPLKIRYGISNKSYFAKSRMARCVAAPCGLELYPNVKILHGDSLLTILRLSGTICVCLYDWTVICRWFPKITSKEKSKEKSLDECSNYLPAISCVSITKIQYKNHWYSRPEVLALPLKALCLFQRSPLSMNEVKTSRVSRLRLAQALFLKAGKSGVYSWHAVVKVAWLRAGRTWLIGSLTSR